VDEGFNREREIRLADVGRQRRKVAFEAVHPAGKPRLHDAFTGERRLDPAERHPGGRSHRQA
jgi:hypothetical protein